MKREHKEPCAELIERESRFRDADRFEIPLRSLSQILEL